MTALLDPQPTTTEADTPRWVVHYTCCQVPDTALCGADLSTAFDVDDDEEEVNCRPCAHLCAEEFCPLASQDACRHWRED